MVQTNNNSCAVSKQVASRLRMATRLLTPSWLLSIKDSAKISLIGHQPWIIRLEVRATWANWIANTTTLLLLDTRLLPAMPILSTMRQANRQPRLKCLRVVHIFVTIQTLRMFLVSSSCIKNNSRRLQWRIKKTNLWIYLWRKPLWISKRAWFLLKQVRHLLQHLTHARLSRPLK